MNSRWSSHCDTDEGYLRMTGPSGFEFGHKWRSTQEEDAYGDFREVCKKESRIALLEILEVIEGVQYKSQFDNHVTKEEWIDGFKDGKPSWTMHDDNCLPCVNYFPVLATDKKFNPSLFEGLGRKLTKNEIKKIENARKAYVERCRKHGEQQC